MRETLKSGQTEDVAIETPGDYPLDSDLCLVGEDADQLGESGSPVRPDYPETDSAASTTDSDDEQVTEVRTVVMPPPRCRDTVTGGMCRTAHCSRMSPTRLDAIIPR
ncbi:MAG: hypothetical protein ABEH86_01185 [Haloarcula sp.]